MSDETKSIDTREFTRRAFYRGFFLGLLPCVILFSWITAQILDLSDKYHLLSSVIVGYPEDEITLPHRKIHKLDPQDSYAVPGFLPVPQQRQVDKVLAVQMGRFLMYAFIEEGYVTGTFISEKSSPLLTFPMERFRRSY